MRVTCVTQIVIWVVFVIQVDLEVVAKVNHDQKMLLVVVVDYVILPEVYHYQTKVFVVHVDYGVYFYYFTTCFPTYDINS